MAHETDIATAMRLCEPAGGDGFPGSAAWNKAPAIRFDRDWQGKNADPQRETEVRILWTPETLFFRFAARYRTITVFDDAAANGRRDHLWDRDVAEVFLQPPGMNGRRYKEFEISPNGFWIDLDIAGGEKQDLQSGLARRARIASKNMGWEAELALPMSSLTPQFDPKKPWRVNFYRVEGSQEPRFYSAWRLTGTPVPNFHVPERFGQLHFAS